MNRLYQSALKRIDNQSESNSKKGGSASTTNNIQQPIQNKSGKLYSDTCERVSQIQYEPNFGEVVQNNNKNNNNNRKWIQKKKIVRNGNQDENRISNWESDQEIDEGDCDENNNNMDQEDSDSFQGQDRVKTIKKLQKNLNQENNNNKQAPKIQNKVIKKLQVIKKQLKSNSLIPNSNSLNRVNNHSMQQQQQHNQSGKIKILQPEKAINKPKNDLISNLQHSLFVRNISSKVDQNYLQDLLQDLSDYLIDIRKDKTTAEIIFNSKDAAQQGQEIIDQKNVHGQIMKAVLMDVVNKSLSHNKSKLENNNNNVPKRNIISINQHSNNSNNSHSNNRINDENQQDYPKLRSDY